MTRTKTDLTKENQSLEFALTRLQAANVSLRNQLIHRRIMMLLRRLEVEACSCPSEQQYELEASLDVTCPGCNRVDVKKLCPVLPVAIPTVL